MNDLEQELRHLPARPAPESLDRRVAETLHAHQHQNSSILRVRVPLWVCAAASLTFFVVVASLRQASRPPASAPPAPVICAVEGSDAFKAVFAAQKAPGDFFLRKKKLMTLQNTGEGT